MLPEIFRAGPKPGLCRPARNILILSNVSDSYFRMRAAVSVVRILADLRVPVYSGLRDRQEIVFFGIE